MHSRLLCTLVISVAGLHPTAPACHAADPAEPPAAPSARLFLPNGRPAKDDFFPVAVWLQNPRNAARYKAAGINLYVALWHGPTAEQFAALDKAGMPVVCSQNAFALQQKDNPSIAAWMHGDEPDNAQSLRDGKGYGPPVLPEKIIADYQRLRSADPTRPVLLNLGQGVAWDNWIGRGVRRNHPEDYPEYVKGCDLASFDIYPANHDSPEVKGRLEFVPRGVQRLVQWAGKDKPVWSCIECSGIDKPEGKPTPAQVRSEVWMALIRGARGLIYFVHQFKPTFREAALLDDPEMLAAVTALNQQIRDLAPVLNGPPVADGLTVVSHARDFEVATMLKHHRGTTWLFAANLRNRPARATITLKNPPVATGGEVVGESRRVPVERGSFSDDFDAYAVHLYKIP